MSINTTGMSLEKRNITKVAWKQNRVSLRNACHCYETPLPCNLLETGLRACEYFEGLVSKKEIIESILCGINPYLIYRERLWNN